MNTFIRLMPAIFACVAAQAFAGDPPTPGPVEPAKPVTSPATAETSSPTNPTTPAATAEATSPTNSAPAPATPNRLVLDDKTLTQAEVNRLLSQGYKPQKGRGDSVLYCRREQTLGTHFEKKVCMSADQIKVMTQDSREITDQLQRNHGNRPGN